MQTFLFALISAIIAVRVQGIVYDVASCDELRAVDDDIATGLTISADAIDCSIYTRFRVRNTMMITATVPEVTFSNFSLKVLGDLTVEPGVVFRSVYNEPKRGGALYVQEGAAATFQGHAEFRNNSVLEVELPRTDLPDGGYIWNGIPKKGGAIHNKGSLVFEEDVTFIGNEANTRAFESRGKGGGISNHVTGNIWFKGKLTMLDNDAQGFVRGGGGIFNEGEVTVEGEAYFWQNRGSEGGAIFNTETGSITFNSFVSFVDNYAWEPLGGGVANKGGVVNFNAGSLFYDNGAGSNGEFARGGGLYNSQGGEVTFIGSTAFTNNSADYGGGILQRNLGEYPDTDVVYPMRLNFPEDPADLVFSGNKGYAEDGCSDIHIIPFSGECLPYLEIAYPS